MKSTKKIKTKQKNVKRKVKNFKPKYDGKAGEYGPYEFPTRGY